MAFFERALALTFCGASDGTIEKKIQKNHTNIPQLNSITRHLENKASSNISTTHTVAVMINTITASSNNYATVSYMYKH